MTVKDTSTSISTFKEKLKKHLLCKQALGDGSYWIEGGGSTTKTARNFENLVLLSVFSVLFVFFCGKIEN